MQFSIIPVEQQISLHPVSEFFEELVQENAIKQNILLDVGGLACLDEQNQIIYLYKRPDLQFMLFIEATYAQALQVFIENFLNRNTITVKTAVLFLTIAEKFNLTEVDVYPLYPLLKWPVSKKGFEFFRIFKTFSHDLQQLVLNKQLSLNDGVFFHQTFQKDYDFFLKKLPVSLSFSERNQVLKFVSEIHRENKLPLSGIDKNLNYSDKNEFLKRVSKLRFPLYHACLSKMTEFVNSLHLPSGCQIHYDQNFEKDQFQLVIQFKKYSQLFKKISTLNKQLSLNANQSDFKDLFDQQNLFQSLDDSYDK